MSDPHRAADEAWLRHLADDKFDGDTDQALWSVVRAARLVDETRTDLAAEATPATAVGAEVPPRS